MLARTFTLALIASLAATGLACDRDGEDIRFAQIKKIDDDKFKKTKFNVHDATVHNKNFNQVENKDKDVLKAVAFRKNDDDDFKHRRFDDGKKHGGIYKRWDDDDKGHGRKFDGKDRKHFGGHRKKGDDDDFKHRRFGDGKKHGGIFKRGDDKGHGRKFRHHKDDDDFKHRRPFHNKKGDDFKHRPFKGKGHGRKGGKGDW